MSAQVITPIIVMGVSGCGKTTLARALANALAQLRSTDDFHPAGNVEKMRAGTPLTDEDRDNHGLRHSMPSCAAGLHWRARGASLLGTQRQRYRDTLAADIAAMHWVFWTATPTKSLPACARARRPPYAGVAAAGVSSMLERRPMRSAFQYR